MPYGKVKVYSDGGHYIGIPYEPNPHAGKRRKVPEEVITVKEHAEELSATATAENADENIPAAAKRGKTDTMSKERRMTRKELFEELYRKSVGMKRRERKEFICNEMALYFKSYELCAEFVEQNLERKHRNMVCRKSRLWRKINQQQFNFFVTFTFDDKLHDEESFRKTLSRCLQHFSSRKGWLYIGVWERAPETKRLHFTGYSTSPKAHCPARMKNCVTSIHGRGKCEQRIRTTSSARSSVETISSRRSVSRVPQAMISDEYLEKTGEKLVYSEGCISIS